MKYQRVHFIGIGGIGMSGLARLYLHEGAVVSGSDATETELTDKLETEGIAVTYEQVPSNITTEIDLVVYTAAMPADHPELLAAEEKGIKTSSYFEALAEVANQYYLIAVAGTHGKSTTSAMLIDILEEASFDPTAIVGTLRTKTGSNFRAGKSKYFLVEACEYKRDFSYLTPDVLVITNLEYEHVDYYKDLVDVQAAFGELALSVPEDGFVICDTADPNIKPVIDDIHATVVDYREDVDPLMQLRVPGLHNRLNAAAAITAAKTIGVDQAVAEAAVEAFAGVWRRFEYKGDYNGAKVYDDYSHHPTEIEAAIAGARELYPERKLTVVFQPHTYSRTKELFDDFVTALSKADAIELVPIYAAREENTSGVTSEQLADALTERGKAVRFFHTLPAAAQELKETIGPDDVVVVMGAGDVTKVTSTLLG